jgi:hypothetical protein
VSDERPPGEQDAELDQEPEPDKKEKKKQKKLRKALEGAQRALDPWERYRCLQDAFEVQQDLIDLADHKARFALIIMGFLNAATVVIGTRPEVQAIVPETLRPWLGAGVALYALIALYYFLQAIETLRPRASKPNVQYPGETGREDYPLGIRFYEDVLARDLLAYRAAWRELHLGQLNAEVAMQAYVLARINHAKYAAARRLYIGLRVMTVLAALILG